jgi:hypothetical protein
MEKGVVVVEGKDEQGKTKEQLLLRLHDRSTWFAVLGGHHWKTRLLVPNRK